jgi:hypothetical protein
LASSLQRSGGVSPAEIYEVEFFDTGVVEVPRLPARIAPLPDEALASWLLRFADLFGVSPEVLLLGDTESDLAAHPEWWRKPNPLLIAALTRGTGVSGDPIRSLSFVDWPDDGRAGSTSRRPRYLGTSEHRTAGAAGDGTGGRSQPVPKVDWVAVQSEGGVPTLKDRLVQMALKLVLEPIFEADFYPISYGFRPGRSTHDALARVRHRLNPTSAGPSRTQYVIEGDFRGCFDAIDHHVLMDRVRRRVQDRKVLRLVLAFLKADIMIEGSLGHPVTGTLAQEKMRPTGRHGGMLFIPKNKSQLLRNRIKATVRETPAGLTFADLIDDLNPVIIGWRNYYRYASPAWKEFARHDGWLYWGLKS